MYGEVIKAVQEVGIVKNWFCLFEENKKLFFHKIMCLYRNVDNRHITNANVDTTNIFLAEEFGDEKLDSR
jgi:hypothetical protein